VHRESQNTFFVDGCEAVLKKSDWLPGNLMDLHLHDFLRTFGRSKALSGVRLPIIGRSLDHKSPQSTIIYARLKLDPVKEAIMESANAILHQGKRTSFILSAV